MPDITPVGTLIQPPNPMTGINTLSGIVGLKQQQQALQTGQYQQATAQAESEQAQQKNAEFQKVGALMQNVHGGGYRKNDGSFDRQKFADDVTTLAPVYGGAIASSALSQANEIVQNQKAKQELTDSARSSLGTVLTSLAKDPNTRRGDVLDGYTQWMQDHKDDPAAFRVGLAQAALLPQNDADPKFRETLGKYASTLTGQPTNAPSSIDSGGTIQPGQTSAVTGGFTPAGAPIPKQLPPQIVTSPTTGGQAVVGGGAGTTPRPIGGTPAAGPNPWQPYAGQKNDIETYRNEVQNVRAEAQQAPLARNINQQILRLTQDAKTGPGSDTWQHVIGAVGAPFGLSPTASYQEVGKFLEKNAIASMQAMGGPPSDSRLDAAAKANGSTSFSPEALRTVTKFNDATTTALDQYRQGIDRTVGTGQSVDYTRLPSYKAAWAKNFDVNVFRVENAIRDGDSEELAKIKKELGPNGLKALAEKRKNLQLLTQGQIP